MSELAAKAERLRVVRNACMDFITLWALDSLMAENGLSDRMCRDVLNMDQISENSGNLYSGRRMDD